MIQRCHAGHAAAETVTQMHGILVPRCPRHTFECAFPVWPTTQYTVIHICLRVELELCAYASARSTRLWMVEWGGEGLPYVTYVSLH